MTEHPLRPFSPSAPLLALALCACGAPAPEKAEPVAGTEAEAPVAQSAETVAAPDPEAPAESPGARWETAASGEGDALFLAGPDGARRITLFCPAGSDELLVNVPAFEPVGSEERMTFGAGGTAVTLVADFRGDEQRGGVSGTGPVPEELPVILGAPDGVGINYGAQDSGPHAPPPPPPALARGFVQGCRD